MCDRAHSQFLHNCLPNEEQIEKPKNSSIFQKLMYEKIGSKANNSVE